MKLSYNKRVVAAFFVQASGALLSEPAFEYTFDSRKLRKWRFDIAWPDKLVAIEVQGGIWTGGAHSRGSGIVRDMEKHNVATAQGWRVLYVQPKDLCLMSTLNLVVSCALLTDIKEGD